MANKSPNVFDFERSVEEIKTPYESLMAEIKIRAFNELQFGNSLNSLSKFNSLLFTWNSLEVNSKNFNSLIVFLISNLPPAFRYHSTIVKLKNILAF
jgi:hypothetical protein